MDPLIAYSIPVKGLHSGIHQFDYQIDHSFFESFEDAPIKEGAIKLEVDFDKRDDMFVLWFRFSGTVGTACDRCLVAIDLPIEGEERLLIKLTETPEEISEDPDVVFVSSEIQKLNIAPYAYEFICLSLPLIKVYDCEEDTPRPCDQEMLKYLSQNSSSSAEEAEEESQESNPIWDALKDLNNNK